MPANAEQPDAILAAAARLRDGGLVAFPTETVYGLGADALNPDAVSRVFSLKGRPAQNPLIVHVADSAMARPLAARWPDAARRLADAFWPGPLTIVLRRAPVVPAIVAGGGETVALRCPDHPLALALLRACAGPLVGPSANPSGRVSPTTAAHVRAAFTSEQVLVLDGGPCRIGIESTVVSLAGDFPRVLRLGAVSAVHIGDVLGVQPLVGADEGGAPGGALSSPGMLPSHYAPSTPLTLFDAKAPPRELERSPRPIVVITHREAFALPRECRGPRTLVRMPADAERYGARLYAALREADEAGSEMILLETPADAGPLWDAIRDRLSRAAARAESD